MFYPSDIYQLKNKIRSGVGNSRNKTNNEVDNIWNYIFDTIISSIYWLFIRIKLNILIVYTHQIKYIDCLYTSN